MMLLGGWIQGDGVYSLYNGGGIWTIFWLCHSIWGAFIITFDCLNVTFSTASGCWVCYEATYVWNQFVGKRAAVGASKVGQGDH